MMYYEEMDLFAGVAIELGGVVIKFDGLIKE